MRKYMTEYLLQSKKGVKDEWKSEADKQGLSLNAFIEEAVRVYRNKYIKEE